MNKKLLFFLKSFSVFLIFTSFYGVTFAASAPNPRSGNVVSSNISRGENAVVKDVSRTAIRRSAVSRGVSEQTNGNVTNRSAARQTVYVNNRPEVSVSRSATVRSVQNTSSARSASIQPGSVSRAASSRATAVFDDVSKIGGGYATCREAYNTCMDQFCAKSSDTYRRCYCSSKIAEFRNTESALDQAKTLLMQFQDNNLNAIDKTASEVTAMYSATIGEQAIKNDPSAAANMLSQIGDLLSGKTKANSTTKSLSSLSLDFSSDLGDIWGENSSSGSSFGFGTNQDLASLEGSSLFSAASKQCLQLIKDSCENNAVLTMAQSSYNILITQDCNTYQKKLDTQKQAVETTVRDAEKILREARLEEYRSHNSADVNACITNVKASITGDMACGANYKKCLDYTGSYIDVNTGEPIYSPQLFKLTGIINLNSTGDVVSSNPRFSKFLDDKKIFAEKALDSCRDKATTVWNEFKRSAIIEIAQAQDSKIEEVKDSCVSTMKECYDTQSGALASFDNTTAQASGALNAYAARQMCADKVAACAALYATSAEQAVCNFDKDGRLTNASQCGMAALLTFVQTVDNVKVAEGCETALTNYLKDVCTPNAGDQGYPYNCRSKTSNEIKDMLYARANIYCIDPTTKKLDETLIGESITNLVNDVSEQIEYQLVDVCESLDGFWQDANNTIGTSLKAFYGNVYGGNENVGNWGRCVQNDVMVRCLANNTDTAIVATYDKAKDECTFTDDWYENQCGLLGNGYYENGICYVGK
ncbi:MAG: hypothetical protein JW985_01335 [Alphaproteobacteria bacterium]|nr:hypothetical protein [Alphaproteobacteria bacterium]